MKNTPPLGRRAALGVGLGLGAALPRPGLAQRQYPDRPVRVLVPWAPGGTTDVQMRALCEAASKRLGQPVVVDNKAGAGGILAAQALASGTRPDGYTLAQMPVSVFRYPQTAARPPFVAGDRMASTVARIRGSSGAMKNVSGMSRSDASRLSAP